MLRAMVAMAVVGVSALLGATFKSYKYGREEERIADSSTEIVPLEEVTVANFLDTLAMEAIVWIITLPERMRDAISQLIDGFISLMDVVFSYPPNEETDLPS